MSGPQRLPMELILHIVDSLIDNPRVIYTPCQDTTQTLLSFTLVCRATYAAASNHLRRQCMYIDDRKRLRDCVAYLQATNHLVPEYNAAQTGGSRTNALSPRLCPITSLCLFLSRFDKYDYGPTPPLAVDNVVELCRLIKLKLKRLILDLATDFSYPHDEYFLASSAGLTSLTELEEVVDFQGCEGEPDLSVEAASMFNENVTPDIPVAQWILPRWVIWPKLRRLALYDADSIPSDFGHIISVLKSLETLIFIRVDQTPCGCLEESDLESEAAESGPTKSSSLSKVVLADDPRYLTEPLCYRCALRPRHWLETDPYSHVKVSKYDLPLRRLGRGSTLSRRSLVVQQVHHARISALRDEIWDWEGEILSDFEAKDNATLTTDQAMSQIGMLLRCRIAILWAFWRLW